MSGVKLDLERLSSTTTLRYFGGHGLPISEAEIGPCLSPYWWDERVEPVGEDPPSDKQIQTAAQGVGSQALAALIRTGAIFVLYGSDVVGADDDPRWADLPKLPFPRVYFEFVDADGDPNRVFKTADGMECIGYGIAEIEEGTDWLVVQHVTNGAHMWGVPTRYKAGGRIQDIFGNYQAGEIGDGGSETLPIVCAQILEARGVRAEEVVFPRPQRRRYRRSILPTPPTVYRVEIGGESGTRGGASDRTYSCRWLVRGHWRHYEDGGKSWVRPYIKGPSGAPWRGRPVYTSLSRSAA